MAVLSAPGRSVPRRLPGLGIGLAALLLAAAPRLPAQETASREYQIKAAFLLNFAQFVQWPPATFASAEAPLGIGVLGEDPFGGALDQMALGETVHRRPVFIRRSRRLEDLRGCQLIFISRSEAPRLGGILAGLDSRPALTVSEIDGFAEAGGDIQFYLQQNKIRFEINPAAARREGLRISSQLLALAKLVRTGAPGEGAP